MGGQTTPVAGSSEGGQTYCLRWNNHQTNLVQILHALHEVGSYVDCTLVVDDEQFKAHRVVLAANSPYFQTILQDVAQDQCSIILPGVKGFEIAALLQYMYTGETTVTKSQEPEILRTAKELQVKGLYDNLMKFNHKAADERSHYDHQPHHQLQQQQQQQVHQPSSSCGGKPHNGGHAEQQQHNSSAVISTSTHISPSAAISSSCSPPPPPFGAYQPPPYTAYPPAHSSGVPLNHLSAHIPAGEAPLTPTHAPPHAATATAAAGAGESGHAQWPLSPSAAAAAMLNSVYESAADMNPLKRKKLSAISSMLLNSTRDTPILRNVLAQANPADSSQPAGLLLPAKSNVDKTPTHQHQHQQQAQLSSSAGGGGGSVAGAGSHSFNGSDYGGDKEPLSPHTDRSFDDETGGQGGKKPEWKRYKQYTRADMMCAIQCVREGMSALQASRKFGLPSRTLYDKVRKLNITTGRGTHRTPKRSPPGSSSGGGVESSAAFPYSTAAAVAAAAHNYGQPELEREPKELSHMHSHGHGHGHGHGHHGMAPTIPHSAAALLDHAFLQQALESRGNDIAGREALHAMALAAAAHAAANRMSSSPSGANGHASGEPYGEQEPLIKHGQTLIKREAIEEERDADDEDDHEHEQEHEHEREREREHHEQEQVEDLSLTRKERPESPYSPPPPRAASPLESASVIKHASTNGKEREHEREHEQESELELQMEVEPEDYAHSRSPSPSPQPQLKRERELLGGDEAQARID
ncbi:hypothetical protein KR093_004624 [Drosophila rubida]|uniref:Broad-complex core protein n=1 Tax=Drosophila rubida TaxID=30044 RepID=A0AAD4K947_9MUSC|nr:hypothetical protein KR093_004624 [Drosophila rubida]